MARTLGDVDRTGRIEKTVRRIFSMARKNREQPHTGAFEEDHP